MGRAHEVRAASMAKTAAAKSKLYAKYGKELYMAAKGNPDPVNNLALRGVVARAKKDQVPADVIKRAIEKAAGGSAESYIYKRFEGFGHNNSMVIVDCLTDNGNRTAATIPTIFSKCGIKMGVPGCAAHSFKNQAIFSFEGKTEDEVLEILLMADCDVDEVTVDEDGWVTVTAKPEAYNAVRTALTDADPEIKFEDDKITWTPNDYVDLDDEQMEKFQRFLDMLEDNEDVQDVYHNVNMPVVEEEE